MFTKNQLVKTVYSEKLEVLEHIGCMVYFFNAKPCHQSKVKAA